MSKANPSPSWPIQCKPASNGIHASGATVAEAVALMQDRTIGCILVTDGAALSGVFTETDANRLLAISKKSKKRPLDEVMTLSPVTITKSTSPADALDLMARSEFKHLPVVEDGALIGIVSRRDFF